MDLDNVLSLIGLNKYFGKNHILKDVSLDIKRGEFLTLLGPSGCGKTTTLRAIGGLETIDSGQIVLNGSPVEKLPPNRRNVNTVFQSYALFPHLNIFENIAYGPKLKKLPQAEIKTSVSGMLSLVKMEGYENRLPNEISGGQRQRIAIARALINRPLILLLDEPLGALDLKLRQHMQGELKRIQKSTETTFIYVTHDQDEALGMSDRLAVMSEGRILQVGSPKDVFENPESPFVAEFVGDRNLVDVKVSKVFDDSVTVLFCDYRLVVRLPGFLPREGEELTLALHTDKLILLKERADNTIPCVIESAHYSGSAVKYTVRVKDISFRVVNYQDRPDFSPGDSAFMGFYPLGAALIRGGGNV